MKHLRGALVALGCGFVWSAASPSATAPAKADLRAKAKALLASHDPRLSLSAPSLRVVSQELRTSFGRVFIRQGADLPDKPFLERALTNEQLRRAVAANPTLANPLWAPMFDRVDRSIELAKQKIGQGVDPSRVLASLDASIRAEYVATAQAVAGQKRLQLKVTDGTRVRLIDVTFQSVPDGAEMEIVNQYYYEAFDHNPPGAYWSDVRTVPTRRLATGGWTYRARWRRQDAWQIRSIDIDRPQTVKIRKEN